MKMDHNSKTKIGDEPEAEGYLNWAYDMASNALGSVSTYLGWSSQTPKPTTDTSINNNPEACQATGKPVCCCNKNKPKYS